MTTTTTAERLSRYPVARYWAGVASLGLALCACKERGQPAAGSVDSPAAVVSAQQPAVPAAPPPLAAPALPMVPSVHEVRAYGAPLTGAPIASLADVLGTPEQFTGKTVRVEGQVRRACTRKGCWMELAEAQDAQAPGCRVTFKDYGFFVPTDSAGSHARVEALVKVERIEPAKVRHLEEEGAVFAHKSPDGSAQEVRLVANGVELSAGI